MIWLERNFLIGISTIPQVTEVMKLLACMWKNLPPLERLEYDKIARADKSRYMEELQHYSGPMQVPNKRQKKPAVRPAIKRPPIFLSKN